MLVKVNNPELYQRWIRHLEAQGFKPFEARTYAYINTKAGMSVPLF